MIDWRDKKVLISGGAGFLGSHVREALEARGCRDIVVPLHADTDLRDAAAVRGLFETAAPDVVIHLAALVGGIGANRARPAEFFYDNLLMGVHLLHESWRAGVGKFVAIGTVCGYPKETPVPFKEEDFWSGYPEETNAPYGLAKKMLLVQSQAYRDQYGFESIYLIPVNLYGPRDDFDPASSHVIAALIRKCEEARSRGDDRIVCWGTGEATREFLFVEDAAEGILKAAERYSGGEPVNLGSGMEISIRELAELIASLTGFEGEIAWDTTQPNGQLRRSLDTAKAQTLFGFRAPTEFREGLRRTIEWYRTAVASDADVSEGVLERLGSG